MDQLYSSFIKLCLNNKADSNQISVMDIPGIDNHKIGVDQESYLNLLIKSSDSGDIFIPVSLEFIEVYYDILCEIKFRGEVSQKNYSIIKLKTDDNILQKYFINIIYLYIKELGEEPTLLDIQKKFNLLIDLFRLKKSIKKNLVQGLFGELCIISISSNADYLIKSWHTSPLDKYDFNDGHEKLEVKTTDNLERIHSFSMHQTNSFDKTGIIASIITTQTDMGLSVFDLVKEIQGKLIEDSMNQKLNEIILKTLGSDFKGASRYFFDYKQAIDSIKYYNSQDIPMILSADLDSRISRVKYDCKIEGIKEMKLRVKSKLQALLI